MSAAQLQSAITILAVDDDRGILNLVESVLQSAGYIVLLADGGRNAIQLFEDCATPVHLLLTDVIMPDLTGPVVAERLLERQPDYLLLLAWNVKNEIMAQQAEYARRGGKFIVPLPKLQII